MKREVLPPRSWSLEIVAVCFSLGVLAAFACQVLG